MDRDRRLSYLILKDIEENDSWSNLAVGKLLKKEGANSPAFVREIVYGIKRSERLLDFNINRYLKKPKLGLDERIWLRMGFYQLAFMSGVSDYAAINETVEIARSFKRGTEKFINAVLRSFQRDGNKLVLPDKENLLDFLCVKYSCDAKIVSLFINAYGIEKSEEILKASNTIPRLCIRVNLSKIDRDELLSDLESKGFEVEKIDDLKAGAYIKGSGLLDTEEYEKGYFCVQGFSSQLAVEILDPHEGDTLLDLCSAPGGKTFACSDAMNANGRIYAFDLYEHRLELLKKEAKRLGFENITTRVCDSSMLIDDFIEKADCVLVDAPCSGLGTIRENPEIKLKDGIDKDFPSIQTKILSCGAQYVKENGKLLYSTCTMNPLENEKVIEDFLDKNKNFKLEKQLQLFTKENGEDGFFICLLRRI